MAKRTYDEADLAALRRVLDSGNLSYLGGALAPELEARARARMVLPEGSKAWTTANTPMNAALKGELAAKAAMQESGRALNDLFAQRPAAWK